ncbi:MAG: hypothetical protein JWO83_2027 [Caulobacteraceae bacterium]|nr:hypothetical protein [Caulobacteraceae bacterium]
MTELSARDFHLVKKALSALPDDVSPRLIGAAILCGVSDSLALLIINYDFPTVSLRAAAVGILAGSVIAAALGILVLVSSAPPWTPAEVAA